MDPVAARPVGDNFNRYAYALNNPYRFTDPDGREAGGGYATGAYTQSGPITNSPEVAEQALTSMAMVYGGEAVALGVRAAASAIRTTVAMRSAATAAASATRVAGVVNQVKYPGRALVAAMNKAGLSQKEGLAAVEKVVAGAKQGSGVAQGANGAQVAFGTGNVAVGASTTAPAIMVGADGAATFGSATFQTASEGGKLVYKLEKFAPAVTK